MNKGEMKSNVAYETGFWEWKRLRASKSPPSSSTVHITHHTLI